MKISTLILTLILTACAYSQTRSNSISRRCPSSATSASVAISKQGDISFSPCSGRSVTGLVSNLSDGSIPFASGGAFSQSNPSFSWDNSQKRLRLFDKTYENFQSANSHFSLGTLSPEFNGNTYVDAGLNSFNTYYMEVEPVANLLNSTDLAAGFFHSNARVQAGQTSDLYGLFGWAESYGNGLNGYTGSLNMRGVYGVSYVRSQNELGAYGGYFEAFTGGNAGGTNTTPMYGIFAQAEGGHNGTTPLAIGGQFTVSNLGGGGAGIMTDARGVSIKIDGSPSVTTYTAACGLCLRDWTAASGTWGTSYGIYADNSIDRGSTRYFIYSTSTSPNFFSGKNTFDVTNTAGGTTGNQTINKPTFSVNFAAGTSSLVITNSFITATSYVLCTVQTNDTTALLKNATPASGSVTVRLNANATAETRVACMVVN